MDDTKALISLYVEDNKWDDAFLLLHAHPGRGERPMKGQATVGINALSSLYPPPLPPPPPLRVQGGRVPALRQAPGPERPL